MNWAYGLMLVAGISVIAAFAILAHGVRRRARHGNGPRLRLRLFDRQPEPRLTREVEREFQHQLYTVGVAGALEWLADLWNVEVRR